MKRWEELGDFEDRCYTVAMRCFLVAAVLLGAWALLAMGGVL